MVLIMFTLYNNQLSWREKKKIEEEIDPDIKLELKRGYRVEIVEDSIGVTHLVNTTFIYYYLINTYQSNIHPI
jgi:hypothetical protein